MAVDILETFDNILLDIGISIESMIEFSIDFFNSFQYALLAIMALSLMWAIFLIFDIRRLERQRLIRR